MRFVVCRRRERHDRQLEAAIRAERQAIPDYYATQNQDNITVDSGYSGTKRPPPSDAYPCQENDYFRTWQLQRHHSVGRGSSMPPLSPLSSSYDTMETGKRRTVEHIYESPKFERKERPVGEESEQGSNVQYYELDPEAVGNGNTCNYPGWGGGGSCLFSQIQLQDHKLLT